MRQLIAISIFVFALTAQASGTRVGDGGHGVICGGGWPVLLDLYEAVHHYERPLPLDFDQREVSDFIMEARQRVSWIMGPEHPSLSIFDGASALMVLMEVVDGPLVETLDMGAIRKLGPGCKISQIAVRGIDYMDSTLEVERTFWTMASNRDRAMFLIHEAGHNWFPYDGSLIMADSSALRQFVGLLYNTSFSPGSDELIRRLLTTSEPVMHEALMHSALR